MDMPWRCIYRCLASGFSQCSAGGAPSFSLIFWIFTVFIVTPILGLLLSTLLLCHSGRIVTRLLKGDAGLEETMRTPGSPRGGPLGKLCTLLRSRCKYVLFFFSFSLFYPLENDQDDQDVFSRLLINCIF